VATKPGPQVTLGMDLATFGPQSITKAMQQFMLQAWDPGVATVTPR
jgi:hypothetical protein